MVTARPFWPVSLGRANWRPIDGAPYSFSEQTVQALLRVLASLPIYIAIIVTLILLIQIFGLPWGDSR